jgi:NADPH-dependent ferric siderophore reductase
MMRVRFGGAELGAWVSSGDPDERITIAFPNPGQSAPPRPRIEGGAWHFNDVEEPAQRSYTVRRVGEGTVDVDFVVHEGGVAAEWAMRAAPGDTVGLSMAGGWYRRPADATTVLLAGDATALPAIGRIVEEMSAGVRVHAIIEVATADDVQVLRSAAEVTYTWLTGSGMGRGPSRLLDAVREHPLPDDGTYVWAAAETSVTRAIRKHLRQDRGMPNSALTVIGYWRTNKESWMQRYEPAKPALRLRREALESAGLAGQDLIEAWDQEMERAGL